MKKMGLVSSLLLALLLTACKSDAGNIQGDALDNKQNETNTQQVLDTNDIQETEETENEETGDFSYADLKGLKFYFSSGVGGWGTSLTIREDGSFHGQYHDSDMGDATDEYPNGIVYESVFTGQFKDLTKVDDLTYSTEITSISYENEVETEKIVDGIRYIYTDAYGLDEPKTIYFYLKGTEVKTLSEGMISWIQTALYDMETDQNVTELPFIGMYNENAEEGFSSYDMVKNVLDNLLSYETMDHDYLDKLQTDTTLTQTDMTILAGERNSMWDAYLNNIWDVLLEIKSKEEIETIKTEEKEWIARKEAAVKEAKSEMEGGSMQTMIEQDKAAQMTKERVYELLELLK